MSRLSLEMDGPHILRTEPVACLMSHTWTVESHPPLKNRLSSSGKQVTLNTRLVWWLDAKWLGPPASYYYLIRFVPWWVSSFRYRIFRLCFYLSPTRTTITAVGSRRTGRLCFCASNARRICRCASCTILLSHRSCRLRSLRRFSASIALRYRGSLLCVKCYWCLELIPRWDHRVWLRHWSSPRLPFCDRG